MDRLRTASQPPVGSLTDEIMATGRPASMESTLGTPIFVGGRLWGVMITAWARERPRPEGVDARMSEFTELVATAIANAESRAELAASRARVVTAADETRRRIERDLHDGTQQRLVSLGLELRAAEALASPEQADLRAELSDAMRSLTGAVEELQEISRGIHPAVLSRGGLAPALKALARRSSVPVELRLDVGSRLPEHVEVASYYVVSEALTNAAKHARASALQVDAGTENGVVRLSISDDGVGGADPTAGSGLVGLRDRVEALGGDLSDLEHAGQGHRPPRHDPDTAQGVTRTRVGHLSSGAAQAPISSSVRMHQGGATPAAMKWWGWGEDEVSFTHEGKPELAPFIERVLGLDVRRPGTSAIAFGDLEIPAAGLPAGLRAELEEALGAEPVSTDDHDRVVHGRGKSLTDLSASAGGTWVGCPTSWCAPPTRTRWPPSSRPPSSRMPS